MGDTRSDESQPAQLARNMGELLQELRVAQAGVQILFAFLLSVTFSARFGQATSLQRVTLIVTILRAQNPRKRAAARERERAAEKADPRISG